MNLVKLNNKKSESLMNCEAKLKKEKFVLMPINGRQNFIFIFNKVVWQDSRK